MSVNYQAQFPKTPRIYKPSLAELFHIVARKREVERLTESQPPIDSTAARKASTHLNSILGITVTEVHR